VCLLDSKSFYRFSCFIFIADRYYSAEEQYDNEHSHKTAGCHLKQVTTNLCMIFQVLLYVVVIQLFNLRRDDWC